jgi:hypothetical protein
MILSIRTTGMRSRFTVAGEMPGAVRRIKSAEAGRTVREPAIVDKLVAHPAHDAINFATSLTGTLWIKTLKRE